MIDHVSKSRKQLFSQSPRALDNVLNVRKNSSFFQEPESFISFKLLQQLSNTHNNYYVARPAHDNKLPRYPILKLNCVVLFYRHILPSSFTLPQDWEYLIWSIKIYLIMDVLSNMCWKRVRNFLGVDHVVIEGFVAALHLQVVRFVFGGASAPNTFCPRFQFPTTIAG